MTFYAEPDDGLNLTALFPAPVREIVVTAQPDGMVTRHDVRVREGGVTRWEYWCYDDASLERAIAYVTWLYPDAAVQS